MNRKQRRAVPKQSQTAAGRGPDPASELFAEAARLQRENKLNDAARAYRRLLLLKPDHAEANNNLGAVLQAQGKLREASACFAQSLWLMPQLFEQYGSVNATLVAVLPAFGEAMRRALGVWPNRLTPVQLFDAPGLHAICDDPMLLCVLRSAPARKIGLEFVLTSLRAALLAEAGNAQDDRVLAFGCSLAQQCFINEYVFAVAPDEDAQLERLKAELGEALASGATIAPMRLAALAMYLPLHALPAANAMLERAWPPALEEVVTQQLREPLAELALRPTIACLTPIEDDVSQRVRQQYEENPYPRWVNAASVNPLPLDALLRAKFPTAAFTPLEKTETVDILVAGCGTGLGAQVAQLYQGARVLAVDLSLSSLCYAKRKTPASLSDRVEYAQGDILKLGAIGRSFDMIDCQGVLHHMRDPFEGWRVLLSLLRPGGFMHLGFYSDTARRDVLAARAFIAEHGYAATPADIRRCRYDLLKTPLASVSRFTDFFSASECRDLLFHVHEIGTTLPAIKTFVDGHGLKFIGFDFQDAAAREFRAMFTDAGWSMSDLGKWDLVETKYPNTFGNMYQFWVQKS
ncbi:MAG TPA: methyltransferase domain-containing protein [Pseudolabrys sp.]|jgi:SAM-dependent methyltransferase